MVGPEEAEISFSQGAERGAARGGGGAGRSDEEAEGKRRFEVKALVAAGGSWYRCLLRAPIPFLSSKP